MEKFPFDQTSSQSIIHFRICSQTLWPVKSQSLLSCPILITNWVAIKKKEKRKKDFFLSSNNFIKFSTNIFSIENTASLLCWLQKDLLLTVFAAKLVGISLYQYKAPFNALHHKTTPEEGTTSLWYCHAPESAFPTNSRTQMIGQQVTGLVNGCLG